MTAALGLGTYRVRNVKSAARIAVQAGAPWIDTAPNYGDGLALHDLGSVLRESPRAPLVATKAGFFTRSQGRTALGLGLLTEHDASAGHCLDPRFVAYQVNEAVALLGRVDLVFVHNPERAGRGVDRAVMHWRLREAFTALEEQVQQGRIPGYGVATWSGLLEGAFSVPDLLALAREAAGSTDPHLIAVQMPVSLISDAPITQALNGGGPLVQAKDAGLITFGSAPLHGGELLDAITPELVDLIRPGLSAGAAGVLAAGSCPALDFVLTSTANREHWDDAAKALAAPLTAEQLRRVTDELATG
ncbi:aldo/keto reductase [Streptomyces sp. ISL-43]|uniref:aldo/keto reductase n=1 Tax=Streptomyces sp. ISL-43 TaxID=2819183 RepID=UPI001BE79677|nr:aldo/keto reductase [Streptomyces sp. ISL-43]MBT2452173.1 aldo/keto reductase [Streptomyces sp. ISL-43]